MDLEKTAVSSRRDKNIGEVNFTHFSIGGSVRKVVDRRSTKDKFSRGREKSISVAIDRQHCRDHCRSSIEKRQVFSRGDQQVTFTYFQLTRLSKSSRQWV